MNFLTGKYTTILFDADDTLLDFHKDEKEALLKIMADYGIDQSEENCRSYSEINAALWKQFEKGEITKPEIKSTRFRRFFNSLGITEGFDGDKVNSEFMNYLCFGGNTIENAVEICRQLKQEGFDLYIITNGTAFIQKCRFSRSGLEPFFTESFISDLLGFQKPRREFFDLVLEKIPEKDKKKILVVGDSLTSDIKGAMNAGLDSVWFNPKGVDLPDEFAPDYIIGKIEEIKKHL